MTPVLIRLRDALQPWRSAPGWCVALSGGLDSTVLLHLLASLAQREVLPPLSAIHIHHGLQAAADAWPAHCRELCAALSVPLQIEYVRVAPGASLEQAARDARYAAFAAHLGADELLLTAQHRVDQAETLLFRLLRGAGVQGLSAMPVSRALGAGQLVRPLLSCSRDELLAYAREHRLTWIEDPSNADERFSRNYLRRQVMPALLSRWPQAVTNVVRSAAHLSEAAQLLDELAQQDMAVADVPGEFPWLSLPNLVLPALRGLSEPRQRNALRFWLRPLTAMPDSEHWAGWQTLRDAAVDAAPVWKLAAGELRRSDERLWWLSGDWLREPAPLSAEVQGNQQLILPANGSVRIEGQPPAGNWQLGYRQAGDLMLLPGRGHRDLKRLFNELRIPAFVRDRLPLLRLNNRVVAIANLSGMQGAADGSWQLHWQPPTNDQGLS
ncbi:tRNA lysidine(34) synthetase TilS [Pseudomonas sp. EA_35y_Pfl2_R111]|uniref:tRNA lysidine(34) synthetase TilS n=1 Tax=Pseudomonas sp. EA_35y_Pfl2_R111 TaxID=3088689 RepID=UPI0030DA0427